MTPRRHRSTRERARLFALHEGRCHLCGENRQMQPAEVLAVELRQYEGQGLRTLVPLVLGQTQEAAGRKGGAGSGAGGLPRPRRPWDEAAVLAEIAADHPGALAPARAIAAWIGRHADRVGFNDNPRWGAMGAVFRVGGSGGGAEIPALRLHSDGTTAVYFEYMLGKPVFGDLGRREELLARLNAVPGVRLPPDAVAKRKTISLAAFTPESTAAFLAALDWFVAELRGEGGAAATLPAAAVSP